MKKPIAISSHQQKRLNFPRRPLCPPHSSHQTCREEPPQDEPPRPVLNGDHGQSHHPGFMAAFNRWDMMGLYSTLSLRIHVWNIYLHWDYFKLL